MKIKLSQCLIRYHATDTTGGVDVEIHAFRTSALDGDEQSASRLRCFIPLEKSFQYSLTRRIGRPQSRFGCDGEEKIPCERFEVLTASQPRWPRLGKKNRNFCWETNPVVQPLGYLRY